MKAHQINEHGEITNTILVDSLDIIEGLIDAEIGGCIGDTVVDGVIVPKPVIIPIEQTFEYQKKIYLDEVRLMREKVLARLNGYGASLYLREPPAIPDEKLLCSTLIQGLLDITTLPGVLDATNIEQVELTVKTEYARLVGLASFDLMKAFRQVDV